MPKTSLKDSSDKEKNFVLQFIVFGSNPAQININSYTPALIVLTKYHLSIQLKCHHVFFFLHMKSSHHVLVSLCTCMCAKVLMLMWEQHHTS